MRHGRSILGLALVVTFGWSAGNPRAGAQESGDDPAAEEARDKAVSERFRKVLESNPRRGTALDRLYGYHVERGTLDKFVGEYLDRIKKDAKDGTAWMIVGLLESQRGKDAAAVAAFRQAEGNLPLSAMPAYYLGQSLVLLGQPDAAAEAFERAITNKAINRNDLLDAFQALGRVYQRAQRTEQALNVWNRLEKLYPDDARVQEQIATTLVEEGQFGQALPRLVKLADQSDDKYRQTSLRMDVADLKVKLKRTPDALADFEKLLGELDPDSWLYRDVRRRIEEVFLRNDDLSGLAKYYESWLGKHPTDVDAFARLAKTLATQGRAPEARDWLAKGVAAAPTHRGLRLALIDQYVFEQNVAAAAKEYEALDKAEPNNPDTLKEWGKLLMRDTAKPEAERRAAAVAVWRRMLDKKPNDPVVTSQVADQMRTAGASDDAIALYKKAIELAPNAAQYREYLGEYYHSLKRPAEALATWRPMAEGANRSAKNLSRLAEVFAGFGYRKEAIDALAEAVSLDAQDFTLLMTYAELLHQEGRNEDALKQISLASKMTSNPEEVEQVLAAEIKVYQATDTLGDRIDELQKELDADAKAPGDRWLRLCRYFEASRQADKATEAVAKAQAADPKSVPATIAAARIYEAGGDLLAAAEANRKLAALDRRYRSEYLTAVAKLEQRLGRREQAVQAGRDLLAASPGNPEVYKFFADLCFQLGDQEEGLEALRRSVRANPSDPLGLMVLASALSERVRQGEAIELLWRAFEKTNDLEGKLGIIDRIAQLYLENNQFDRLLERLERERREAEKSREMTLCIAQAYSTAGDLGTARQQVERLLTENTRDTHLLGQLSTLCEAEGDLPAAVKYQRQLNAAAPNNYDHSLRLAQLLTKTGESEEAADIWVRLVANDTEAHRTLSSIDSLLTAGKTDAALAVLNRLILRKPGNWELLYREGAALMAKGQTEEAARRFNEIIAMKTPDDELSEITKNLMRQAKKKSILPPKPGQQQQPQAYNPYARADDWELPPLTRRSQNVYRVRTAVGIDSRYYYGGGTPIFYSPADYGEVRMATLGWLYEAARAKGEQDAFVKRLKTAAVNPPSGTGGKNGLRAMWDWYYFQSLRGENRDMLATSLSLSKVATDPSAWLAFLNVLGPDRGPNGRQVVRRAGAQAKDTTPPLPADQLNHAVACFRKLKQAKPEWATGPVAQAVMAELKRARRADEEKALYQETVVAAVTPDAVRAMLSVAAERDDLETLVNQYQRLEKLQGAVKNASQLNQLPTSRSTGSLEILMQKRGQARKFDDVLKVLDLGLSVNRRLHQQAPRTASVRRQSGMNTGTSIGFYSKNGQRTNINVAFPSPNEYYDATATSLLYHAYSVYKDADLLSDLTSYLRKQADAAQGMERLYARLGLGYVHWWAGEKDEALTDLTEAVKSAPGDHNLLMEVAGLREQNNDYETALSLLDSIAPLDTQMMQRREEAALRLAERTGNLPRARQAAERLFGLRLDADKQLELAGKMHRLGMADLAETVLGRAQRQAGNKTATLLRLMSQYQSQNQTDLAVQIARQILRKGPSINVNYRGGMDENASARNQAIGVLARSGNLKDMIERAEAQLKASPKSLQINQALASYYQAAGDKAKLKAALLKMAELKPDDGKLRYQVAQQLEQSGERGPAIDHYKVALKLEPSLFANNYWQIQNLFMQMNRLEELGKLFDEIDLRKVGYYYYAVQPIAGMLQNDKTRDLGLKLFKKAWEAFPQQRGYLLGQFYDPSVWRLPEIYTYAKEAVIPREDADVDPWQSASAINSYGQDGRCESVLTRMMSIARRQQRLPELRAEVAAALAKRPDWIGGKALLGVIDIQSGDKERGKAEWREAFAAAGVDVPPIARFLMSQELEFYAGCEDLAVSTLEGGLDELLREGNYQFSYGPARRLAWWYKQLGRDADARRLLLRFANPDEATNPGYGGGYWEYRIVSDGIAVAQEFVTAGEPVEAVRIYNRLLADRETLDKANQYYDERFDSQIEQGLKAAIKAVKPSTLPTAVATLLLPRAASTTDKSVLDLVVLVESRELSKATLNSVLAAALKSTEKAPEIRRIALAKLSELTAKHPSDFSVQTAAALAAFADGKPEATREAVERLVKLMESSPLEPLPPSGKANARQRNAAVVQMPLWLVARECLAKTQEPLWPAGETLAARSAAAAKRQQDPLPAIAILREWGQIELDRGDKNKAEACWAEMLDLALPKPPAKKSVMAPVPSTGPNRGFVLVLTALQPVPPSAVPAAVSAAPSGGSAPVVTAEQFRRAHEVADLAADKGLAALSLQAMREALRAGPPLAPPPSRGGFSYSTRIINGTQYMVPMGGAQQSITVDRALLDLTPKWRKLGVPAADIYALVAAAMLPDARPAEVFLYNEGQVLTNIYKLVSGIWMQTDEPVEAEGEDRGLSDLIVRLAIEAGKTADLRKRVEARSGQPLGELPAKLLLLTLALKTKDDAGATQLFQAIGERIKKDSLQGTNDRVKTVLVPAFADPKYAAALAPTIEKIAQNYAAGNNQQQATELRFKLAAYYLSRKDETAARAQFKAVAGTAQAVGRGAYDSHLPLAKEYLKAGWVEDALRELGLHADNATVSGADPRARAKRAEPSFDDFPRLVRLLLEMPADKRYDALKAWSMPTASRKSVRYFVGVMPRELPPAAFCGGNGKGAGAFGSSFPADEVVSTMLLMADAAKSASKLDELTAEADKLAAEKVENADVMSLLIHLSRGQGKQVESAARSFVETTFKRLMEKPEMPTGQRYYYDPEQNQPTQFHPSEFLFAKLCLADPSLAPLGKGMLGLLQMAASNAGGDYTQRIHAIRDKLIAAKAGCAPESVAANGVPARWNSAPGAAWFAQDGYLVQAGNLGSSLIFDAPLTGTFEFSVDSWTGNLGAGNVGYGGVVFMAMEGQSSLNSTRGNDAITRMSNGVRGSQFNRLTVQVAPDKVRYLVNGKLVYEDTDPPPTAPWPMLVPGGSRPVFRNFTIAGKPEVLSEVKLIAGDYLDGWSTRMYGGLLPPRLTPKEKKDDADQPYGRPVNDDGSPAAKEPVYDWKVQDGELIGRKLERAADRPMPSQLGYYRPLRSGDRLRYEFFYEPGQSLVHPSLGRIAFLLKPDGIKLHWLTDATADDWTGVPVDNAVDDPGGRRGSVTLKAGNWNALELSVTADGLKIELNGTLVYESTLAPDIERVFGFFHYRDRTGVRVRNVTLTGDWPKAVGSPAEVALTAKPCPPAVAIARRRQLGGRYFAAEAGDVAARGAALPPAERYKSLAEWVLPTEARPEFQLAGIVQPRDGLDGAKAGEGRRILLGGRLQAPCLEMIAAANECGALDELCERLSQAVGPADDELFRRSQMALLAVARAAQGREAEAAEILGKLTGMATALPPDAPGPELWPDLVAAAGTLDRPALAKPAAALADVHNKAIERSIREWRPFDDRDWWLREFRAVRARAEVANVKDREMNGSFANWAPVSALSAEGRAAGWGVPTWLARGAAVIHYPGHSEDYLILRTPVRGDFEVSCGLTFENYQAAQVRYGSYEFDLEPEGKKYKLHETVREDGRATTIEPALTPKPDKKFQFRLAVKGGWLRAFVDGREIASQKIGANPDPWLMLHASHLATAEVRDLRIAGRPSVPDRVDLLAGDGLAMWRPYELQRAYISNQRYYSGNNEDASAAGWEKRGEEMYHLGKKPEPPDEGKPIPPRGFPESMIYYQRPLIEDGAVEYEFFYDPDKALVHPTLDRLTFLLEPEGIKLHRLTDGPHDKGGTAIDNATDEPACRRGPARLPLNVKAWNRVRLAVAGETVSIALNGTPVYERSIEPTNQRLFGLFHYTDRTEARVRSVTLTGDWPKQIPPTERLFEAKK